MFLDDGLEEAANKWGLENQEGFCTQSRRGAAFKAGAEWKKAKMTEEAVDGYVTLTLTGALTVAATIKEEDNIGFEDKVRVIVIKEDEK